MHDSSGTLKSAQDTAPHRAQPLDRAIIQDYVRQQLARREAFLETRRRYGSPLYVLDTKNLQGRAEEFRNTFRSKLPDVAFYYAMKSNNHPAISRILMKCNYGLDVSSGEELNQAIGLGATDIIFSGPGKTRDELALAVKHAEKVTVLLDSFGELERLETVAAKAGREIRAGVRLCTEENGLWRKFGIPLSQLAAFLGKARARSHVALCGLQFHISWNLNPAPQIAFLRRLGEILKSMDNLDRQRMSFLDIGGGYWPPDGEWRQFPDSGGSTEPDGINGVHCPRHHYYHPAEPITSFADQIARAVGETVYPHVRCTICLEPGRWLCHDAMHIVLTVIDKKADDLVITDGGTNAVGWERFETDYFPVINLTRPGLFEQRCLIAGSLCTPHDIWGYGYWGRMIEAEDVLVVPSQGAYTYSLRQNFIKPVPRVVMIGRNAEERQQY